MSNKYRVTTDITSDAYEVKLFRGEEQIAFMRNERTARGTMKASELDLAEQLSSEKFPGKAWEALYEELDAFWPFSIAQALLRVQEVEDHPEDEEDDLDEDGCGWCDDQGCGVCVDDFDDDDDDDLDDLDNLYDDFDDEEEDCDECEDEEDDEDDE